MAADGLLPEHLEHPVGDDVAADDVHRREDHGDEREDLAERVVGLGGDEHRADQHDAVDRVGARHQRRVERRRDLADDLEPDQDRQDEDRQGVEQGFDSGVMRWPPAPAGAAGSSSFFDGVRTTAPPWVMTVAAVTSSSKSRWSAPSLTMLSRSVEMLRA